MSRFDDSSNFELEFDIKVDVNSSYRAKIIGQYKICIWIGRASVPQTLGLPLDNYLAFECCLRKKSRISILDRDLNKSEYDQLGISFENFGKVTDPPFLTYYGDFVPRKMIIDIMNKLELLANPTNTVATENCICAKCGTYDKFASFSPKYNEVRCYNHCY